MKLDSVATSDLAQMPARARALEEAGYDGLLMARSRQQIKQQIAFYGSTPAYRMVLETHGWEELQGELNAMSKRGLWVEMGELIGPDVLDAFTVQAESPQDIAAGFVGRFGDLIDRTAGAYMHLSPERERQLIDAFRSLSK